MSKVLLPAFLSIFLCVPAAFGAESEAARNLKAFPPAEKGMVRHVLQLPPLDDEDTAQVQLLVGRTESLDPHNRYFLAGKIEAETIKGWGFTRYMVRKLGPMAGTLMAVDPAAPKVERFVSLGGEPFKVRYNSRLPLVVYVPKGAEVRYRIWRAEPETPVMEPG